MNCIRTCLVALLLVLAVGVGYPQSQHIHIEDMKGETRVDTNFLYLNDEREEFVEVQLRGWFKGKTPQKPPRLIQLWFYAISSRGRYRSSDDHKLNAVTDADEWKVGTLEDFLVLRGETNNGKEAFFPKEGKPVGMEIPVPRSAQVRDKGKIDGLTAEAMMIEIKPEQLLKLARAKTVSFHLGKSATFTLGEGHLSTLREFAAAITPP